MIVDCSNLIFRTYWAHQRDTEEVVTGLAMHTALLTLRKYFNKFKPDAIVLAFDRSSWRKDYTASEKCVSKLPYKGDRRQNQTDREKERFERFYSHVSDFENLMRDHSSAICLAADKLEADDLIAGFVDSHPDDEIIIVSQDKDFVQLLDSPNVKLHDPQSDKERVLDVSRDYHLFLKCIRANEDNVQSAYPGVRSKRLEKAWNDPFEMANLMEHKWTRADGIEFRVKDLFEENQLLMDLRAQPDNVVKMIAKEIRRAKEERGKFNIFYFLKFCGKFELENIKDNVDNFVPMMSR